MRHCWIGLGGNQGDVRETFRTALQLLNDSARTSVSAVSSSYHTAPMGAAAGCPYWNAAAELLTELSPEATLDLLQSVEQQCNRVRETHWGPRTLDLDLILYEQEIVDTPRLRVPHPHFWYRRFALDPLVEIAPQAVHPEKRLTVLELRNRLLRRPLPCSLAGGSTELRQNLIAELQPQFPDVTLSEWTDRDQQPEPALLIWLGGSERPAFSELPVVPRLDATSWNMPLAAAVTSILQAALGS